MPSVEFHTPTGSCTGASGSASPEIPDTVSNHPPRKEPIERFIALRDSSQALLIPRFAGKNELRGKRNEQTNHDGARNPFLRIANRILWPRGKEIGFRQC